jgi:phage terminase Nu1 subunit (DNA packaging protein)
MSEMVWLFNEAVSLLREARRHVPNGDLADEIDESLPRIQAALVQTVSVHVSPNDGSRA